MEKLGILLVILVAGAALYALGRLHGGQDRGEAYTSGLQTGHQAGWNMARTAYLDWARQQQRAVGLTRNQGANLYRSPGASDPDTTVVLPRVA